MEQQTFGFAKMIMLLLTLVGVAQLGLALRAFLMEKREGLVLSSKRLLIVSITSWLLVIIALFSLTKKSSAQDSHSSFPLPVITKEVFEETSQENERIRQLCNILKSFNKEITNLDKAVKRFRSEMEVVKTEKISVIKNEIPKLNKAIDQLRTTAVKIEKDLGNFPQKSVKITEISKGPQQIMQKKEWSQGKFNWLLLIIIFLILVETIGLLFLGDRRTLVSSKWLCLFKRHQKRQPKSQEIPRKHLDPLDCLAGLIDKDQYERALDLAGKIDKRKLERLDSLDFSYLKSFCIVQILIPACLIGDSKPPSLSSERKESLLAEAVKELTELLDTAPRRAEAQYLLGVVLTIKKEYRNALELFKKAQESLSSDDANFNNIKSFCLLKLAGDLLIKADLEGANELFDEVVKLEVFKDQIPIVQVENRLLNIMKNYKEGKIEDARQGLANIKQVKEVSSGQKKAIEIILESMEIMLLFTEKRIDETLKNTNVFLGNCTPSGLPEPDDETADEFLSYVASEYDLPFPVSIFRAFYFLKAAVMLQLKERQKTSPGKEEIEELAHPLLRSLQFEPRNRDVLACLGALYLLFLPHKMEKALEWLEASYNMGIESDYIRRLLEKYREIVAERKHILDRFRTLTTRFLADGSVNTNIKQELAKELGQFQEFRPILIELGDLSEIQQKSPTLQSLLHRVEYLDQLSKDISKSKIIAEKKQILSITQEYTGLVEVIKSASIKLETFEKQLIKEIAKQVLQ
jgi:tetratricopeptide (TPR) repeat protein